MSRRLRHRYHNALKKLVLEENNPELTEMFEELEKEIDSGKFYPKRIQRVRGDIEERVSQGKGPLSQKGINLIYNETGEEKYKA